MRSAPSLALSLALAACSAPHPAPYSVAPQQGAPPPPVRAERISPARADTSLDALDLHVGTQSLDNEIYWAPIEDFDAFSLWIEHQNPGALIGFEMGLSFAGAEEETAIPTLGNVDLSGTLFEWMLGAHRSFLGRDAIVRPYLGAGLSLFLVDAEVDAGSLGTASEGDGGLGFYLRAGLPIQIARRVRLGVEARTLLGTEVDIAGASGDVDHSELSAFLGFAW
jgi:hypothetical protein